jgi:hypothetical protein
MKTLVMLGLAVALAGCAARGDDSEREWQRAECNRIIDSDARTRCMKRVDNDYGSRKGEAAEKPAAR